MPNTCLRLLAVSLSLALAGSFALVAIGVFCIVEGTFEWHHHWLLLDDLRQHRPR